MRVFYRNKEIKLIGSSLKNKQLAKNIFKISDSKIIEIFCKIDDFMLEYDIVVAQAGIATNEIHKRRNRKLTMSDSEVMTIMIHLKPYKLQTLLRYSYLQAYARLLS